MTIRVITREAAWSRTSVDCQGAEVTMMLWSNGPVVVHFLVLSVIFYASSARHHYELSTLVDADFSTLNDSE